MPGEDGRSTHHTWERGEAMRMKETFTKTAHQRSVSLGDVPLNVPHAHIPQTTTATERAAERAGDAKG